MRKKFRYFIKTGTSYYYVVNGQVSTTTTKTPFAADPIEWRATELTYSRNVKYHGLNFKYSAPLSLVEDAALILRYIMATQYGFESEAVFEAEILQDPLYVPYYSCDIDFLVQTSTEHYVQLELLERGVYTMIKDRENTPYEIPLIAAEQVPLVLDGIGLEANYVNATLARNAGTYNSTQLFGLETIGIDKDGAYSVGEQKNQAFVSMGSPLGPSWSVGSAEHNNYIYKVDPYLTGGVDARVKLNFEMQYTNPSGTGINYHLEIRALVTSSSSTSVISSYTLYSDPSLAPGSPARRVVLNLTSNAIHLNPDDRLYVVFYIEGPGASGGANQSNVLFFGQQRVEILLKFRKPSTLSYGYWYRQLFSKLVNKVTDGLYGSRSDYLSTPNLQAYDSKPYNAIVLSGDSLRKLGTTAAPAVIKTSLAEFFKDAAARWMLGLGVEVDAFGNQLVRMEHLSYFYQNTEVTLTLPSAVNFQWSYNQELIHGQLSIGNKNFDYDNLNGKDEPNTTTVFKLPVTRKPEEWDLVAPYRADIYGIESIRVNLTDKKSTDANSDNDVFVVEAADSVTTQTVNGVSVTGYLPRRPQNNAGNSATGLIDGSKAYNLSLSPKRNLLRNGPLIRTAVYQQDGKIITYQINDKNSALTSNLGSGTIVEKANVPVSSLSAPLFLPILFQFETAVPENLPELIAGNPYGRINFTVVLKGRAVEFGGFISEVSVKPATNAVCQWSLIACPDTNLGDLVY